MASAKSFATDRTLSLGQAKPSLVGGMVSVTTISSMGEDMMRSMAGPDSTPCVA